MLTDDLTVGCPVCKYVDDSTLSEVLQLKSFNFDMMNFLENLLDWTAKNDMQLNASKTKEMVTGPLAQSNQTLGYLLQ